jgi:hypothetical protein
MSEAIRWYTFDEITTEELLAKVDEYKAQGRALFK